MMTKNKSLHLGQVCAIGPDKQFNEDYMEFSSNTIEIQNDVHIFIIADGMGGHAFGDVASFSAVNFLMKWWNSKVRMHHSIAGFYKDCQKNIIDVFQKINQRLIEIGKLENSNIGTTLSVLIVAGNEYFICHIGDSRIYRFRTTTHNDMSDDTIDLKQNKPFIQLTKDHSWASMQIENGSMTRAEAESHSKAHLLTQCIGIKGSILPYTTSGSLSENDHFLLCSDGFYSLFTDGVIKKQWKDKLADQSGVQEITDHFYTLSKAAKYHDDVSILIVNFS